MEPKKHKNDDLLDFCIIWQGRLIQNPDKFCRIVARKLHTDVGPHNRLGYYVKVVTETEQADASGSKCWQNNGEIDSWVSVTALISMAADLVDYKPWLREWLDYCTA